ncbi:hypothetical protein J3L16_03345 [Alteromonas sp. 5E99-2]|uniref:hypothetical protein n=1 Tax=Alteromonas sp. 5E99-2 TaxID=2817683 RepID=UPI001A99572D|nr:hypothetical protein [Alteromonas sp. 5E99-2]MBO1254720.1 hypothetical protein [Alteromonas sp. 5E99-2]
MTNISEDRRKQPRSEDLFFKMVVGINLLVWGLMIVALWLYHYGRPELSAGFYKYLGVSVRETWKQEYFDALIVLLQASLGLTLVSIVARARRSRRKNDDFGFNLFLLAVIILVSLVTLLAGK